MTHEERERNTRALLFGDAVAAVAKPIARASDAVLGTHLTTCGGCANRRRALNALGGYDARNLTPADEANLI